MFDPYHKWLGILLKDQPPNHYRLLGVEAFETDLDVIEGAADRQMAYIRQYQSGEHAAAAAKILNELANARLCLLKPATKTAYDAKLRAALAPPESDFLQLPFSTEESDAEPRRQKARKKKSAPTASGIPQSAMIGGGIAVASLLIFLGATLFSRPKPTSDNGRQTGLAQPAMAHAESKGPSNEPVQIKAKVLWEDSKLVTEPIGLPTDLLKFVDLKRDVFGGKWEQATSGSLIADRRSQLYLPIKVPEDYQLKFAVRRLEDVDTLVFGFMMSGWQGMIDFDGWNASSSGLHQDGRESNRTCTTWRGGLFKDGLAQIVLTVHPGHLHASFDGKTIVDWHGNPDRLALAFNAPAREGLFVWTAHVKYVIESASLIPIKPEPAVSRPARLEQDIEILPLIDQDRDRVKGVWAVTNGKLYSPEGHGQIYLPCIVPEEYTLSFAVEIPTDSRGEPVLVIGLPAGDSLGQIHIKNDDCLGLELIDGRRWNDNETRLHGRYITPGTLARIDCTVTKQGIRMDLDGRTLIDWRGEFHRLSPQADWVPADARRLYLGSLIHLRIRDMKLTAPLPPPPGPAHKPITAAKPVDLLALIDPARDALVGKWTKDAGILRALADVEMSKLTVPVDVPESYRLSMRIARETGGPRDNLSLGLLLPVGKTKADIVIDSEGVTGMSIGHTDWNQNKTLFRGPVISSDPAVEINFDVTPTGIKMTSQQKTIIDWTGNPDNLKTHWGRNTADHRITLAPFLTRFRIEKLEIQAIPSTSFPAVKPVGVDGKLLPVIDLARDTREGEWKLEGDALICPQTRACRLRIPVPVPPRYVLSANVERIEGVGNVYFGLPISERCTSIGIDHNNGTIAGIDRLNGLRFDYKGNFASRKYQSFLLPQSKSVPVRCYVLPDTIVVTCGEIELIRWHGDSRRLTDEWHVIPANYSEADRSHICLAAWDASVKFRDLELRSLTDAEANELLSHFTGPFPTTSQADIPLSETPARIK